jgi:hypothetical protein
LFEADKQRVLDVEVPQIRLPDHKRRIPLATSSVLDVTTFRR